MLRLLTIRNENRIGVEPAMTIAYRKHPLELEGLISFWDFQERDGENRVAAGPGKYELKEMNGPVCREEDGVFGPYASSLLPGQWFSLPRKECPLLNLHGAGGGVTVAAWMKWKGDSRCQAIAGMWDETRLKRQYALFLNLTGRYDSWHNVHGHVSGHGGPTPGQHYCVTYSTGATALPFLQWTCVAMTYDGKVSKVYVDGKLDAREEFNPYPYEEGMYDGGFDGADFTVGAVHAGGRINNFFDGSLGGLAVYNRALGSEELANIGEARSFDDKLNPANPLFSFETD
jgi:hypothetical protein